MDTLNLIQGVLAVTLIGVVGFLGVQRGTVTELRETNADLRSRTEDLLKERTDDKAKITELENAVRVLSSTVTGEAHLVALAHQLNDHHNESMTKLDNIADAIGEVHR